MAGTISVFDNYYNLQLSIDGEQYQLVYAFFRERTSTEAIASSYSEALFKISALTETPVQDLLAEFGNKQGMEITLTIAYYLNTFGSKKFMYGVMEPIAPNDKVQRNIVQ